MLRRSLAAFAVLTLAAPAAFAQADLTISGRLEAGDERANAGDRLTVEYRATNRGNVGVDDPTVGIYLSGDAFFSGDDLLLETDEPQDLDPFESDDESEQFTLASVPDGDYFILLVIDPFDRIAESNEFNNVSASALTVGAGGGGGGGTPDLRVGAFATRSIGDAASGATVIVDYRVFNDGDARSGDGQIRLAIYLSDDAVLSADDAFLRQDLAPAVAAGASVAEDAIVELPPTVPAGDYFLIFEVDDRERVAESDETNNTGAVRITVEAGEESGRDIDLVASSISRGAWYVRRGSRRTLSYRYGNTGTDAAGRFAVTLGIAPYGSDAVTTLRTLSRSRQAAGSFNSGSSTVRVPNLRRGWYEFVLTVDAGGAVAETDEANNTVRTYVYVY